MFPLQTLTTLTTLHDFLRRHSENGVASIYCRTRTAILFSREDLHWNVPPGMS